MHTLTYYHSDNWSKKLLSEQLHKLKPYQKLTTGSSCEQGCKKICQKPQIPAHELLHAHKIIPSDSKTSGWSEPAQNGPQGMKPTIPESRNLALEELGKLTWGTKVDTPMDHALMTSRAAAVMFKQGKEICALRKHEEWVPSHSLQSGSHRTHPSSWTDCKGASSKMPWLVQTPGGNPCARKTQEAPWVST